MGTSAVLSVLNKPGLVYWASGLAVKEFGCPDPKILTKIKNKKATQEEIAALRTAAADRHLEISRMTVPDYIKLLDKAYRAHATNLKDTAEEGENLHLVLSLYVRWTMGLEKQYPANPRIEPFIRWTDANVDRFLWSECNCFSRTHHIGGISDCGFVDKQGRMGILDFKSSKEAYENHFLQIALYDIQINENGGYDAEGKRTFGPEKPADYYAVLPFGSDDPKPCLRTNVFELKSIAIHTLELYKFLNKQDAIH